MSSADKNLPNVLPHELLPCIGEYLPRNSLTKVVLTCRAFHRWINPLMYRFVFYWEVKEAWWYFLDRVMDNISMLYQGPPAKKVGIYQPAQIYDLSLFLQTMEASPELRSQVAAAGFDCGTAVFEKTVLRLINLLAPSAQFLHVWPARSSTTLGPPWTLPLTSLALHYDQIGLETPVDRNTMHALFCKRGLRCLHIGNMQSFSGFARLDSKQRRGSSEIIQLRLGSSCHLGPDLVEMLAWPKALKSFNQTIQNGEEPTQMFSQKDYIDALYPQRSSLEVLQIRGDEEEWAYDRGEIRDLHEFTSLRRLGLPLYFLMNRTLEVAEEITRRSIYEILPSSLQELEVQLHCNFKWSQWSVTQDGVAISTLSKDAKQLVECLHELAQHKKNRFPLLRGVIPWKFIGDGWEDVQYTVNDLPVHPDCVKLISAFAEVDIIIDSIELRGEALMKGLLH
jgi:hypothetical protein